MTERVQVNGMELMLVVPDIRDWAKITRKLAQFDLLPFPPCGCGKNHGRVVLVRSYEGAEREVLVLALAERWRKSEHDDRQLN